MDDTTNSHQSEKEPALTKVFILVVLIFGFVTAFSSGYVLSSYLASEHPIKQVVNISPTPNPGQTNRVTQNTTKFLPGKSFFEDTILVISKDSPQITLVATSDRNQEDKDYAEQSRVSYFDGKTWTRKTDFGTNRDSAIVSDSLVKSWMITIDPSRVLKQTVQAEITMEKTDVKLSSGLLQNEIVMRSLPGYTKFMSVGNGTMTVNGKDHQVYFLYTSIYSANASDIQFYSQPFGLTTDWIVFWDTQGNFYHVDATSVDKPTPIYQTHHIGVMEDANATVSKTFDIAINRDTKIPPVTYTVSLHTPIEAVLHLTRVNEVNKSPDGSFTWWMGNITGSVVLNGKTLQGVGLLEYIHD